MAKLIKSYFPHDDNSRNDQKLLKVRTKFNNAEGYGMFWMFIESMSESSTGKIDGSAMAELQLSYGIAIDKLIEFVDYCVSISLFTRDENGFIYTNRMLENKAFRHERSESGKRGAASKWGTKKENNDDSAIGSAIKEPIASKESKVKKVNTLQPITKPTIDEIRSYCNEKGFDIDPAYFWNYYETRGWMLGKNKIKSWKACVRTWVLRNKAEPKKEQWTHESTWLPRV